MAYRTIHTKPNGIKYVYESTSYWDKDLKAPRNKQVCMGRLDEATGNIVPTSRGTKSAQPRTSSAPAVICRVFGPTALLGLVAADIGLIDILKQCFPVTTARQRPETAEIKRPNSARTFVPNLMAGAVHKQRAT